jgi:hypothetical protein
VVSGPRRTAQWALAIAVALPLLPLALSLCAGMYLVVARTDRGTRSHFVTVAGGVIALGISALGVFVTYELVLLIVRLAGGH